jgi:hypothetical protein
MPIPVACDCGKKLRVKDELAGRKVRCPECKGVVAVPAPPKSAEDEALDVLMSDSPDEPRRRREDTPEPERQIQAEAPPPAPKAPPAPARVSDPPKRKKEKERQPRVVFEEGWFGSINSGVLGGLLMVIIAIVWFFLGLMANRIFFYPPILLVIGIISMLKGLFGGDD